MDTGAEAETNDMAGDTPGQTTLTIPLAASEPQEYNKKRNRRRCVILEPLIVPGDWRSKTETTLRQQAREMTQLYRIVETLAKTLAIRAACEAAE